MFGNMETSKTSKEKLVKDKIENGLYYEAHQLIKSIINRKLQKKHINSCISILFYFSSKFEKSKQYDLLCDLMYQCCDILVKHNISFNLEYAKKIIEIFEKCPSISTKEKYKFMNKCIIWSKSEQCIHGYIEFHKAIGYSYFEDRNFDLAHNHFIYLDDNEILYKTICLWQKDAYPSESNFFVLRSVLCLNILHKFEQALDLINMFESNLNRKDVPLPIQLAYLITCACIYKSSSLYDDVKYKYRLILSYDPEFDKYIKEIDISVFEKQNNSIFSFFQNILT